MNKRLDVFARRANWGGSIEIMVLSKTLDHGHVDVAGPLVFTRKESGLLCEPTMNLSIDSAQMLMDELWRCGLRPSEGSGSAGSLAATERHLNDMQKITFMLLQDSKRGGRQ